MEAPKKNRKFQDTVTLFVGGVLLIGIIGIGWLPRNCPLLRQWLSGCPSNKSTVQYATYEQQENTRIPNQIITKDYVEFQTDSQNYRKTTEVKFTYKGDLSHQLAHLGIRVGNQIKRIALVSDPLLIGLNWTRYTTNQPNETLYQRNETYQDVSAIHANLPPASQVAIDEVIASQWGLDPKQYTPLEPLSSLDGINYIITTYEPPLEDGTWRYYDQTFDTTDAFVDTQKQLNWMLFVPDVNKGKEPFRMTTVHIDYRTMK